MTLKNCRVYKILMNYIYIQIYLPQYYMPTTPAQASPCPLPTSPRIIAPVNPSQTIPYTLISMTLPNQTFITVRLIPRILYTQTNKIQNDISTNILTLLFNIIDIITRTDQIHINMNLISSCNNVNNIK